jgi:hypothetical protein
MCTSLQPQEKITASDTRYRFEPGTCRPAAGVATCLTESACLSDWLLFVAWWEFQCKPERKSQNRPPSRRQCVKKLRPYATFKRHICKARQMRNVTSLRRSIVTRTVAQGPQDYLHWFQTTSATFRPLYPSHSSAGRGQESFWGCSNAMCTCR